MPKVSDLQDAPVFSYRIASGDMRYIEIGVRDVYLRNDPEAGLIFRGEIAGCGPECFDNLSEIFLEYALSCEGCLDPEVTLEEVVHFGRHLADILLNSLRTDLAKRTPEDKLSLAFECILNSMGANYTVDRQPGQLSYALSCCPLSDCAERTGLRRSVEMGLAAFIALCKQMIQALAPEWELQQPANGGRGLPISAIILTNPMALDQNHQAPE